jgi:hypothetical protein
MHRLRGPVRGLRVNAEQLVRVVAPHFVAGIVMAGDVCTAAAPILRWAVGKTRGELRAYFARRGWTANVVPARARC